MGRSGYTCVRHVFCTVNVILWLSGCAVIGLGVWLRLAYSHYTTLLPQHQFLNVDSLAVFFGVIMFSIAFFGCCGSWFESRCLLITYFSLVIFIFLVEFLCATLAITFRENLASTLRDELKFGIEMHYAPHKNNSLHTLWNEIQTQFHCCGVTDYQDWYDIQAWQGKSFVPDSCCLPDIDTPRCGRSHNPDNWNSLGCADQVHMWFVERLHIAGAAGLVVTFLQLFGLLSSMLLFCTVNHRRSSPTYKSYNPTPS